MVAFLNKIGRFYFVAVILREFTVVQLVDELHYKAEGCGFHSRWGNYDFSLT
jgi:hypothetical protein